MGKGVAWVTCAFRTVIKDGFNDFAIELSVYLIIIILRIINCVALFGQRYSDPLDGFGPVGFAVETFSAFFIG